MFQHGHGWTLDWLHLKMPYIMTSFTRRDTKRLAGFSSTKEACATRSVTIRHPPGMDLLTQGFAAETWSARQCQLEHSKPNRFGLRNGEPFWNRAHSIGDGATSRRSSDVKYRRAFE